MNEFHPTFKSYFFGFVICILFTLSAYSVAISPTLSSKTALTFVIVLALLQFITQLVFFLHLGKGKSGWNLFIFATTLVGMLILVFGSLWIMDHLNTNMSASQMTDYVMHNEGIKP